MKRISATVLVWFCCHLAVARSYAADDSLLKQGDRWLFVGDSITHTDTYRQVVLLVLQHFHPTADIMVGNSAVSGVASDYDPKQKFVPTVVTIMLGMNDVIHQDWSFDPDLKPKTEAFRRSIAAKVRQYREDGATVVLMTPTYTDERFPTYFNVACTRRFLTSFGRVVREIAESENCLWLPVAEELEAYQNSLGINQHVRPDGVHPYGLGQYQIGRTLWQRFNLAGALTGVRRIAAAPALLPVTADLTSRFMHTPADGVSLQLTALTALKVTGTWSLGDVRGPIELSLGTDPVVWKIPVPATALQVQSGSYKRLVFDLTDGTRRGIWLLDLARVPVLKMKDGSVSGSIATDQARSDGAAVGTWRIEERGNELWFSGAVNDSDNSWSPGWPFMRDGVMMWLDLRPANRFAGINLDRDVYMAIVNVRTDPEFSATLVPWLGPRLAYSAVCGGAKTITGYRWHLGIAGNLTDAQKFDVRRLDYFGFNFSVADADTEPERAFRIYTEHKIDAADQARRINLLMIVDRKGVFPDDETTNLHLFGP